jgi:hypothetical protein
MVQLDDGQEQRPVAYIGDGYVAFIDAVDVDVLSGVEPIADDADLRAALAAEMAAHTPPAEMEGNELATYDELTDVFPTRVNQEVSARITAHASLSTQINMSAMAAGGLFDADQMAAYQAGLAWVAEVRAKGKDLTRKAVADYDDDAHWPVAPENAVALAELF